MYLQYSGTVGYECLYLLHPAWSERNRRRRAPEVFRATSSALLRATADVEAS